MQGHLLLEKHTTDLPILPLSVVEVLFVGSAGLRIIHGARLIGEQIVLVRIRLGRGR